MRHIAMVGCFRVYSELPAAKSYFLAFFTFSALINAVKLRERPSEAPARTPNPARLQANQVDIDSPLGLIVRR